MKKISLLLFLPALLLSIPLGTPASKKEPKDLPEQYRKWLEEEAIYIIRPKEKDIFLQLETDKEREIFIDAFWKQRDPTPGTPENEFKNEHYRRFNHANKFFGRETTRPGWMTDRGRIYIILGDPIDIDRYEGAEEHYPMEVWFYQGDTKLGLPSFFNVAFFKRRGVGEYILYSPVQDGPQNLLKNYYGDPTDYEAAYEKLYEYDPVLALVSVTLIPSERPLVGHPSLASEIMISNVISMPQKKVDDVYAEKLLRYKDTVEVEYTANYIGSDALVDVIQDSSGIFFVHFSVDPETLSIGSIEDKYYSHFELNALVTDSEGRTVFQYQKTYPLNFSQDQLQDIKLKSYSIQDMFPLIPGHYKLSVLLKNTVSKEFTSFETDIIIPAPESLIMTPLLLSYDVEEMPGQRKYLKPFGIERFQFFCQPKKTFVQKEELTVFFQILGLSQKLKDSGSIKYTIFDENQEVMTETVMIRDNLQRPNYIQRFPLQSFRPGYYTIKASLFDNEGKEILQEKADFSVSSVEGIARPWVISKALPVLHSIEYSFLLGNQLLNKGQVQEAKATMEGVYRQNPQSLKYAYGFSRVLFLLEEFRQVKSVLKPFSGYPQENYEFLSLLGKSSQSLQEYEEAIRYYKQYLNQIGTNLNILNAVGECYFLLGNNAEALIAWEKSLEIEPNQTKIKEKVSAIKDKE